jgi:hypothetical protein
MAASKLEEVSSITDPSRLNSSSPAVAKEGQNRIEIHKKITGREREFAMNLLYALWQGDEDVDYV